MSQEILVEEVSPFGNLQAVVEVTEGVIYMYLWSDEQTDFSTKTVWVRNLSPAPAELDVNAMKEGLPPLNPASSCRHPQGLDAPNAEDLSVVWLPEGNGVALFESHEILAIIPPWGGQKGFDGYARDQIGEGPLAWELLPDNLLYQRFADAQSYWDAWSEDDFWVSIRDPLMKQVEQTLGPHSNYYAIDGGQWPPKALIRITTGNATVLVTIGVSLVPQPNVELSTDTPQPYRRIELGAILPLDWSDEEVMKFAANLSGNSTHPWQSYTWLGPGHTITFPGWRNSEFDSALLVHDHPQFERVPVGPVLGDPVNILWYLPITRKERELATEQGSQTLLESLPADRWKSS